MTALVRGVTAVALLASAAVARAETSGAKVEIPERAYDAGRVDQGTPVRHAFVVRNVGTADLSVVATPGCSCTVAAVDPVVAPGREGAITAVLDTGQYKGRITKTVAVATNDATGGAIELRLTAEVIPALTITPTEFPVVRGKADALPPVELTLASTDAAPFEVLRVDADPPLTARVTPATAPPPSDAASGDHGAAALARGSNRYRLTITASADAPVGRAGPQVTITTSHPHAPPLSIRVNLVVLADLEVVPEQLTLRATPPADTGQISIRAPDGDPVTLVGVESSDPDFTATTTTVRQGRAYEVSVRYTGRSERRVARARLTVRTDDPRQRTIVIPLAGRP